MAISLTKLTWSHLHKLEILCGLLHVATCFVGIFGGTFFTTCLCFGLQKWISHSIICLPGYKIGNVACFVFCRILLQDGNSDAGKLHVVQKKKKKVTCCAISGLYCSEDFTQQNSYSISHVLGTSHSVWTVTCIAVVNCWHNSAASCSCQQTIPSVSSHCVVTAARRWLMK